MLVREDGCADFCHSHVQAVQQYSIVVAGSADVTTLTGRVILVDLPGFEVMDVQRLGTAQSDVAPCVTAGDDYLIHVRVGAGEGGQTIGCGSGRGSGVLNAHQFRRSDDAEFLDGTELVRADGLHRAVLGDRDESCDVTDVRLEVGVDEHEEGSLDAGCAILRRSGQDLGDLVGMLDVQRLGDLAEQFQGQLTVDCCAACASATVELVGAGFDLVEAYQFAYQCQTLTDLHLHCARNVIFVQVSCTLGVTEEYGVLVQGDCDVLRGQRLSVRCYAFAGQMLVGQLLSAVGGGAVGEESVRAGGCCVDRQPTTIDYCIARVAGHRFGVADQA